MRGPHEFICSASNRSRNMNPSLRVPRSYVTYGHRACYRIVFKEKGVTIFRVKSLSDVMTALAETVRSASSCGILITYTSIMSDHISMQLYNCPESWDGFTAT
jgi:hypothetical protein